MSQRNLLCSIPMYLGQHLAEFPPFPRQTREKEPKTQQSMEQLKTIHFIIIINCHWECQLCIEASVLMLLSKNYTLKQCPEERILLLKIGTQG